jgi:predicted nucleotidyltransferase
MLKFLIAVFGLFAISGMFADTITTGTTEGDVTLVQDSEIGVLLSGEIKIISSSYKYVKANLSDETFFSWSTFSKDKFQSFSYTDGNSFSIGDLSYDVLSTHGLISAQEIAIFVWRGITNDLPEFISGIRSDLEIYVDVKDRNQVTRFMNKAEALHDLVDDRIDYGRNQLISLHSQLSGLDGQINELQEAIDQLQSDIDTREQQVSDRNDTIDIKDQKVTALEDEKALLDPVADADRIAEIDTEITKLKADVDILVKANEKDNIANHEAEEDLSEAEEKQNEYENLKKSIPEEIAYLETEKSYLEANLENISELIDEYDDKEKDLYNTASAGSSVIIIKEEKDDDDLSALGLGLLIAVPIAGVSGGMIYEEVKADQQDGRGNKDAVRYDNYYQGE